MLYAAIVLCAFLAAITEVKDSRPVMRADNPVVWTMTVGFVYWSLSLGNGFDWIGYFRESECLRLGHCDEAYTAFEPLFTELLRISAWTDYQIVPLVVGAAACVAIFTMAKSKHFNNFSILFFISITAFYLYIEQIRQGIAMCFLFLTLENYIERRKRRSAFYFLTACAFHWTSFLFVVPFFIGRAKQINSILILSASFTVFLAALSAPQVIFDVFLMLGLGEIDIAKKIFFYAAVEEYNASAIGLGFLFDFLLMVLLIAPIRLIKHDQFNLAPIVFSYFAILLLSRINISVYRISLVFVPFMCLYFATLNNRIKDGFYFFGIKTERWHYGLMIAMIMVAQASRPFTDPILKENMLNHKIYVIDGAPSPDERSALSELKCDFLENNDKGFLCGRW